MRSALLFVLVVSSFAEYEITGKFTVLANSCMMTDPDEVTDFYLDQEFDFTPEDDISQWPYNDSDPDVDVASSTLAAMDRVYVLKKSKTTGEEKPVTTLYLNYPDCTKMSTENCPSDVVRCEVIDGYCVENACPGISEEECERIDYCKWFPNAQPDERCVSVAPPCNEINDVFTCVKLECKWTDNKCEEKSTRRSEARTIVTPQEFDCVWNDDGITLVCTRKSGTGRFTMQHEVIIDDDDGDDGGDDDNDDGGKDGAVKVLATLTVVVFAVIAVLF